MAWARAAIAVVGVALCAALFGAAFLSRRHLDATAATAASHQLDSGSDAEGPALTPTTAVRALQQRRARIVFPAGLEGSGHHLFTNVYSKLQTNKAPKLQSVGLVDGISCHSAIYNNETFGLLEAKFAQLDPEFLYTMPQKLSYPHCGIRMHRARMRVLHPHVDFFKQAADKAGADFHVLFLFRPLADSLLAGCVHRHFEPCKLYAETLVANAGFLADQLSTIGAETYHCFKYGDLESMATSMNSAYGPTMEAHAALKKIFRPRPRRGSRDVQKLVGTEHQQQMLEAEGRLREACEKGRVLSGL